MARAVAAILCFLCAAAGADEPPSDTEIAQHYFEAGRSAYAQGRYPEAVEAFRSAARLSPRPELDYDLGVCLERLGRRGEAIDAFERFLTARPDAEGSAEVRGRLLALRSSGTPPRRLRAAAIGMSVTTVVLAATAAGLLASAAVDYGELRSACGQLGTCPPSSWAGVERRDRAGKALFGVASVALVVDVGLWIGVARRRSAGAMR